MKLRFGKQLGVKDSLKLKRNTVALKTLSESVRLKELETPGKPRESSARTKVTLKFNGNGNLRGMHNAVSPPEPEHMRKIRAMRKFYGKQMPVLQCANCAFASSCPQFKAGYECAFLPFLNSHRVESARDLVDAMRELCTVGMRRAHFMTLTETLSGGAPSLETTEALGLVFSQLNQLNETMMKAGSGELSLESEDQGVIARLFGNLGSLVDTTREASKNEVAALPPIADSQDKIVDVSSEPVLDESKVHVDLIRAHSKEMIETATGKKLPDEQATVTVSHLSK